MKKTRVIIFRKKEKKIVLLNNVQRSIKVIFIIALKNTKKKTSVGSTCNTKSRREWKQIFSSSPTKTAQRGEKEKNKTH